MFILFAVLFTSSISFLFSTAKPRLLDFWKLTLNSVLLSLVQLQNTQVPTNFFDTFFNFYVTECFAFHLFLHNFSKTYSKSLYLLAIQMTVFGIHFIRVINTSRTSNKFEFNDKKIKTNGCPNHFLLSLTLHLFPFRPLIVSTIRRRRDFRILLYMSGPVRKVNIVSNDHGRTHKCDFFVFDRKYPFWANLDKKNQNCQFKLKCVT